MFVVVLLLGGIGVALTLAFFFTAKPEHRFMYGVSFALRILGGYLGGLAAQHLAYAGDTGAIQRHGG